MLSRLLKKLRGPVPVSPASVEVPRATFAQELQSEGRDITRWMSERRLKPALYSSLGDAVVERLRQSNSPCVAATLRAAERVLRHEFDLLGSGPFVPVDPDRRADKGYTPIDWYLDPVRGLRFPRGIHYKAWKLYEMRPGNADVKYPWELARCQHWATLGQAFALTRDERFALEIARELDDFVEANPVSVGVNWTCTMDIAIRAANWAIGLELVRSCAALDDAFWARAFGALFDHAVFIRGNLENTYEVTSNHFLSNVIGLHFVAAVFADMPSGAAWSAFVRESLETEINVQVLPDGADFESSIPYHRLVAELFMGSMRLAEFSGQPLSPHYVSRVRDMVAYLAAVTRPDGLMPQVGDADDGRLHVFGGYGWTSPQDGRHLFGPAAAMFGEDTWARLGGDAAAWEAAWWGLTPAASAGTLAQGSRLFPEAGVAIARAGAHYLAVTNAIVGTKGFGNHKHNDQLSFEYHHDGIPLIVDPGSYVYTSDFDARNLFRSTASHNTLQIDGLEQNDMKPEWIFRLFESAQAEHVSFADGPSAIEYVGRHHGYERFDSPVVHERTFRLSKGDGAMVVLDRAGGSGSHEFRWHFHLAPGVVAAAVNESTIELRRGDRRWDLTHPTGLRVEIQPAAYSPSYGVKVACEAVVLVTEAVLDGERRWEFGLGPR